MTTYTKTQTINNLTPAKPKKEKHTNTHTYAHMRAHTHIHTITTNKTIRFDNHWSLIPLNINALNSPIKRHRLMEWIQKQDPSFCYIKETHLNIKDRHYLRVIKGFPLKWT